MLRLVKYLKPYLWLILIAVALLFVQANADLALPDYLSRIVNTGIQQGGIDSAVPLAIRQTEMDRLFIFMSAEDKSAVLADYTLVDKNSADYAAQVKKYPALADGPIYIRKNLDKAEITRMDPIMGKAISVVWGLEQALADPAAAKTLGANMGFDLSKIPAGMDIWAMLPRLPAATLSQMMTGINQKFDALGSSVVVQMAAGGDQGRICCAGHEYQPAPDQLHFERGRTDAVGDAALWRLHHRGGSPVGANRGGPGAGFAPERIPAGGEFLQHRVR